MIRPIRVVLRNFGSWKKLDFPLADQGLVLLTGATGSGKSTIFRAVYWCLFGKTPEGHRVSDLIRHRAKFCYVTFQFEKTVQLDGESVMYRPYTVTRFRNHPVWKNKVRLEGPGFPTVDPDSLREDTDPLIESLLGFGPEIFAKVFYFVQRDSNRFSSMTDLERKSFLESLTHGAFIARCEKAAREHSRDIQSELDNIAERQRTRSETLIAMQQQSESNLESLRLGLEELRKEEDEAKARLSLYERQHGKKIGRWYDNNVEVGRTIHFCEAAITSLSHVDQVCGVCFSPVSVHQKKVRLERIQIDLDVALKQQSQYDKRIGRYEDLQEHLAEVQYRIANLTKRMHESQLQIAPAILESGLDDEALRLDAQQRLAYTNFWVRGFGPLGLRTLMLRNTVQQMTRFIDAYLSMIDVGIKAEFTLDKNRVVFLGPEGRSLATFSGGERQALDLAVGLALRNLLELSTETLDSLILDEPFEGLDSQLQVACQRILYALPKKSVFLVTHTGFLAKFDKEYEVQKVRGISQLRLVRES